MSAATAVTTRDSMRIHYKPTAPTESCRRRESEAPPRRSGTAVRECLVQRPPAMVPSLSMAEVVLRDIRKSFDALEIIHGVSLSVKHGEFVVFVGPSGCGKST